LIKLDKLVFNIDKITAYQSLIEEDENKWMRFVFSQLLKYWKDKDLINFKDYLELKEYELNHYINHPIQDLWFEIQEEIAWYLVDRNLAKDRKRDFERNQSISQIS
jgi:tRNA A37 N6-isopentenylltransferase MiaA